MSDPVPVGPCTPLLVVSNCAKSIQYYRDTLGFAVRFSSPDPDPFFAIVGLGSAQIMLKVVSADIPPRPNTQRSAWVPWDIFVFTPDPDSLAKEFEERRADFHESLGNRDDGLRGFSVADPDGYVCFFGCPR